MKTTPLQVYDIDLQAIFNLDVLPKVTIEVTVDDWNNLLDAFDANPGENFWIPSNFTFTGSNTIPDQQLSNVAIRVRGNSSRNRPEGNSGEHHNPTNPIWRQASFALNFSKNVDGQTFSGLNRLDLKFIREDPTRIREVYCFDLYQKAGVYSGPMISMCQFYLKVNDGVSEPAYFGIYKLKEFIEDDYLDARKTYFQDDVPGDKRSFLWKGDNGAALNNYDPSVIENGDIYDLRTHKSHKEEAYAQLTDFVKNLVTLEGDDLKNWANEAMDVRLLFKSYLLNVICGNMDDYWYNSNNYNFYFNTHGKFFFIPNDFDSTLGTGWGIDAAKQDPFNWGNPSNPLIQRLVELPDFHQLYIDIFHELVNETDGPFYVSRSVARIKKWQTMIQDYIWDETIHYGCQNADAGCILQPGEDNYQVPYEDKPAWWSSGGNNANYKLIDEGDNNFFKVSGDPSRIS